MFSESYLRTYTTSILDLLVPFVNGFLQLAIVTKTSILDIARGVDLPLSLLDEFFQYCLSVRCTGQLAIQGKTVRVAKYVLSRFIICSYLLDVYI